jgi:glycosyltransferase involved in cell wall biosynthesis
MIRTIVRVTRSEGIGSALRRARERAGESLRLRGMLIRGVGERVRTAPLLNVSAMGPHPRLGGVPTQMIARLDEERSMRNVALLYPGILQVGSGARQAPHFAPSAALYGRDFELALEQALDITGARAIHLEGTAGLPIGTILRMANAGLDVILTPMDFALFCARLHLVEQPAGIFCGYSTDLDRCRRCLQPLSADPSAQPDRRAIARDLLQAARAVVFISDFLRDKHRELFALPDLTAHMIEPAVPLRVVPHATHGRRARIAYAGSVKPHKGAHLLRQIIAALANEDVDWHVFGGGDEELLRSLRNLPNTTVHGYYRAGALPSLLARHAIDLGLLLSILPETFSFTLSECWAAGVPAAAFAHGAIAERISREGGGWLAPMNEGVAGIVTIVRRWLAGELTTDIPAVTRTPRDTATDHVALYRSLGLID